MCKSEVQAFVATISRCTEIMLLLFLAHRIPLRRPLLVGPNIEELRCNHDADVVSGDGDQNSVASMVVRYIIRAIDVDADDITRLDALIKSQRI